MNDNSPPMTFCFYCYWNHPWVVSLVLKENESEICVHITFKTFDKKKKKKFDKMETPPPNRQVQQQT